MAETNPGETREQTLGGGSFYGSIQRKWEQCDAIFTDLQHSSPRKLPCHSHELPFFALLIEGSYGERYGQREAQFGPFTIMFRPAGVPHQDEIGPRGVKFFEIELRPSWRRRMADCSGALDTARQECRGGELLWLGMKLFREMQSAEAASDLCAGSLLAEMLANVALVPEHSKGAPRWLARVKDKLRAEFCRPLTLDELGQEAGVHPVHLSRVFRKCVGEGIGDYMHRLRIREACEQMLMPELTLADVSFATGFADQSHFTRVFRKVTGMRPGEFRKLVAPGPTARNSYPPFRGPAKLESWDADFQS